MDKIKMDWVVREIEQRFGTDAPYIVIVYGMETKDINVSSNMGIDDMIGVLVKTAEHVEENGVALIEPEAENGPQGSSPDAEKDL